MKTNSVKNDNNTVTVTATFDQAEWQKECKAALKNLAGRAQIKGFRNGRVPAAMIKKVYGEAAIEETAAEKMSRQHLDAIIEEA
ncbi:MAG: trigger factor family protein, partial [Allobaculum sp.]